MSPRNSAETALWHRFSDRDPTAYLHSVSAGWPTQATQVDAFVLQGSSGFEQGLEELVTRFLEQCGTGRDVTIMCTLDPDSGLVWATCWADTHNAMRTIGPDKPE